MPKNYFHDTAEAGWQHVALQLQLRRGGSPAMISLMRQAFMIGIVFAGTHRGILDRLTNEAETAVNDLFESNKENGHG